MRRMRSPEPDKHGRHRVHSVPERKVRLLQREGWELVDEPAGSSEPSAQAAPVQAGHRGGGRWRVTQGDQVLAQSVTRDEARRLGAPV